MAKISAFAENEIPLLAKITEIIKDKELDLYNSFSRKGQDLEILANVVSRTASLRNKEKYGLSRRDITTLVDTISLIGTANRLNLPTRAILGRSFMISKINFYYFILKILPNDDENNDLIQEIKRCCEKLVFTLMAEETYELIIENNLSNKSIVRIAADELSYLWEYRMDRNLNSFSPPLMALWRERCTIIPVLGTLRGTMELLRLSSKLPDEWINFLSKKSDTNIMGQALEEFIFGLSYEEITDLRKIMTASNMSAICRDDAIKMLKKEDEYKETDLIFLQGDAKGIYSFFHKRLHDAKIRRVKEAGDGPMETIEELFLMYLLEKKRDNIPVKIGEAFSKLVSKVKD